jgi:4-carboxymuconolactone decarboxylase
VALGARWFDTAGAAAMMPYERPTARLELADAATLKLVRLSAIITNGSESDLRRAFADVRDAVPDAWVEELVLQSYLFAGFPRGLTAAREWRRVSGRTAPQADEGADYANADVWRARGEETCATVYGARYEALRANVRALHPALEAWMIVEGYGKVLSRPGLDLQRRELCVIASCAAARQDRQLHSHLHGALNVGVAPADIEAAIDAIADILGEEDAHRVRLLWARVLGK